MLYINSKQINLTTNNYKHTTTHLCSRQTIYIILYSTSFYIHKASRFYTFLVVTYYTFSVIFDAVLNTPPVCASTKVWPCLNQGPITTSKARKTCRIVASSTVKCQTTLVWRKTVSFEKGFQTPFRPGINSVPKAMLVTSPP